MERSRLIVKNFGPLKDIEIEVREMVTFIGAQASGKSTLAKLLSIFEDENFRRDDLITFKDELKKYNIFSYLKKDTFILYQNDLSTNVCLNYFRYENSMSHKAGSINWLHYTKGKENNLNSIEVLKDYINFDLTYTIIKVEYFKKVLALFSSSENSRELTDYLILSRNKMTRIDIDKIFEIINIEKKAENYISIYESIVSLLPEVYAFDSIYIPAERNFLHLIEGNVMGLIKSGVNIPEHILNIGNEYEKAIQTIKELPINIVGSKIEYKREGKSSYIYHSANEKVDLLESASGLQSVIPILLLVEYSKSLKEEYNFNFVVEEPELNLYPKAQHLLIQYLIKNCLFDRKNLILTTHSPFILASINNLLLAYDKGQKFPKEVNKIIKKESWLNPKNFIAYELKNGKAKKIMNDKLGQISENMIDGVSDSFADEFNKLLNL